MTGTVWVRLRGISATGPGAFLVVVVAVALLFCHGVFGYAHQSSPSDAPAPHAAHAAGVQQPNDGQDVDETHPGDTYFATLFVLLLGSFLLPAGKVFAVVRLVAPEISRWNRDPVVLPPPRGPTLPSLQAFRL